MSSIGSDRPLEHARDGDRYRSPLRTACASFSRELRLAYFLVAHFARRFAVAGRSTRRNPMVMEPPLVLFVHMMVPDTRTELGAGVGQTFIITAASQSGRFITKGFCLRA